MGDNFLSQGIDSCSRGNTAVDLMMTNVSELIGDVKTGVAPAAVVTHWWNLPS